MITFTKNIAISLPVALLMLLALSPPAQAYQQTMTCTPSGTFACEPGETALPVLWPGAQTSFVINERGTNNSNAPSGLSQEVHDVIVNAFAKWSQLECPGFEVADNCSDLLISYGGITAQNKVEFDQSSTASNINLVIFHDSGWNQVASAQTFALTSVTYIPRTGQIVDADLEINADNYLLNIGDPVDLNLVDLENTMVHEVGHFVGMDHSIDPNATMFASAQLGETLKRTLSRDDIEGICASYPPTFVPERNCENAYIDPRPNPNPNEDRIKDAGDPYGDRRDPVIGCAAAASGERSLPGIALGLLALFGVARRRRFGRA